MNFRSFYIMMILIIQYICIYSQDIEHSTMDQVPGEKFYNYSEIGMLLGFGHTTTYKEYNLIKNDQVLSINVINGYKLKDKIWMGLGLGYNDLDDLLIIPVYIDLRFRFELIRLSPYIFLNPGYSMGRYREPYSSRKSWSNGGTALKTGIGFDTSYSERIKWSINIGYYFQSIKKYDCMFSSEPNILIVHYNFLLISTGISF